MIRLLRLLLALILAPLAWGATLISCADGNFTAAATWCLVDATSYLDSEANNVVVGVANVDSQAFVPGAITVDGVAVKVLSRNAVPGANTFTVTLRNTTAGADVVSVTINVSDIDVSGSQSGWYMVKFANQLLVAGNNYIVRCVASAASMVTLYRNATAANVSRMLRTTTTQAPAANDQLHVSGEWTGAGAVTARTVTMDNNAATSFGPVVAGGPPQGMTVDKGGTITWVTAASTQLFMKGATRVNPGGTWNMGTAGTPIAAGNTALFEMSSAAAADSGFATEGTTNIYGATKANNATLLTANAAGGTAILTVGSTAGWLAGDVLVIASTSQTAAQTEAGTIQTVDSPTQVTLTGNLANTHSGTSPTQAEVINLTENVLLRGASIALSGYISLGGVATVNIHYVEMKWLGSATAGKRGVDFQAAGAGTATVRYSSVHDCTVASSRALYISGATSTGNTLQHVVTYNTLQHLVIDATSGTWEVSDSTFMTASSNNGINIADAGGTFSGNTLVSAAFNRTGMTLSAPLPISNFVMHANGGGLVFAAGSSGAVVSTMASWRNLNQGGNSYACHVDTGGTLTFNNLTMFGNQDVNIKVLSNSYVNLVFNTLVSNGDSTFATGRGIQFDALTPGYVWLYNSNFSTVAGIKTAHGTADLDFNSATMLVIQASNTIFAGASVVTNVTTNGRNVGGLKSGLYSIRQNGTAGNNRRYQVLGNALTQHVVFHNADPSEELIPNSASFKYESGPKQAAVGAGNTVTWSVWVYKTVGYGGAQPRLILRANPAVGVNSDVVLDTMAGGAGAWEELTGITPAAAGDDAVFEAFVDCDTAGSIYVDDWSANGTLISENRSWWQGVPIITVGGQPIGGDQYWWAGLPAIGFPPSGPTPGGVPVINNPILISRRLYR